MGLQKVRANQRDENDIATGRLVVLDVEGMPPSGFMLTISAVHQATTTPGPAGRWFINHLKASTASGLLEHTNTNTHDTL